MIMLFQLEIVAGGFRSSRLHHNRNVGVGVTCKEMRYTDHTRVTEDPTYSLKLYGTLTKHQ